MKIKAKRLLLIIVFVLLICALGTTYGYFATKINNNSSDKSISVDAKNMAVKYGDGTAVMNFSGNYLLPGNTAEKTFTVTNTGNVQVTYSIFIEDVVNEFERTQDLRYVLYINNEEVETGAVNTNSKQYLYYDREIAVDATDNVRFVFTYSETEEVQNVDMNKNISFKFNIDASNIKTDEGTGNTLALTNSTNVLNSYRIYGNSIQDGTPTVTNPVEIQSVGDKTVNLFNYENYFENLGSVDFNQVLDGVLLSLKPNTDYVVSTNIPYTDGYANLFTRIIVSDGNITTSTAGVGLDNDRIITTDDTGSLYILSRTSDDGYGFPITLSDFAKGKYWIQIEEGTTATEYEPYGYKIPIIATGKNLFDKSKSNHSVIRNETSAKYWVTKILSVEEFDNMITEAGNYVLSYDIEFVEVPNNYGELESGYGGGRYGITLMGLNSSNTITIQKFAPCYAYREAGYKQHVVQKFTITESDILEDLTFYAYANAYYADSSLSIGSLAISNVIISNIQVEKGTTATDYESYANVEENIYLDEPLRKIGEYIDYIDFKKQVVVRNVNELIVTGEESEWESYVASSIPRFYRFKISDKQLAANSSYINQKSNYFTSNEITTSNSLEGFSVYYSSSLGGTIFRLRDTTNFSALSDLQSFLKDKNSEGNPLRVYYDRYESLTVPVKIPSIISDGNFYTIKVNTGVEPSSIYAEY